LTEYRLTSALGQTTNWRWQHYRRVFSPQLFAEWKRLCLTAGRFERYEDWLKMGAEGEGDAIPEPGYEQYDPRQ
jgi:hypothetical protein